MTRLSDLAISRIKEKTHGDELLNKKDLPQQSNILVAKLFETKNILVF